MGLRRGLEHPAQRHVGKRNHEANAETTPLRNRAHYQYELDLPEITELWRRRRDRPGSGSHRRRCCRIPWIITPAASGFRRGRWTVTPPSMKRCLCLSWAPRFHAFQFTQRRRFATGAVGDAQIRRARGKACRHRGLMTAMHKITYAQEKQDENSPCRQPPILVIGDVRNWSRLLHEYSRSGRAPARVRHPALVDRLSTTVSTQKLAYPGHFATAASRALPARCSASIPMPCRCRPAPTLEVLAASGVEVMLAENDEYTPTPAVSHAILRYNKGRSGSRRRRRGHATSTIRRKTAASSTTRPTAARPIPTSPAGSRRPPMNS